MIIIPSLPSLPPLSFFPLCRRGASGGGDDGGGGCGGGWRRRWRRRAATAAAAKMRREACAWEGLKPHPPGPSIGADGRRSPGVARAAVSFRSGGTRQASLFLLLLLLLLHVANHCTRAPSCVSARLRTAVRKSALNHTSRVKTPDDQHRLTGPHVFTGSRKMYCITHVGPEAGARPPGSDHLRGRTPTPTVPKYWMQPTTPHTRTEPDRRAAHSLRSNV